MPPQNVHRNRIRCKLNFRDVLCPICTTIYIEPVSLPCKHVVCKQCLEKTVESNTLTCPICRARIGSFLRHSKSSGKLVDEELWQDMKEQFPQEIKRKQNGEEDSVNDMILDAPMPPLKLAERGSIKEEFEQMLSKIKTEEERSRLADEAASEKLAQQIMEQEMKEENNRKRRQEEIVKADMLYIQTLLYGEKSQKEPQTENNVVTSSSVDGKSENQSLMRTKPYHGRDSIAAELRHFTPICIMPKTPPKRLPNGKVYETKLVRPVNMAANIEETDSVSTDRRALHRSSLKVYSNNFVRTKSEGDTTSDDGSSASKEEVEADRSVTMSASTPEPEFMPQELIKTQEMIQSQIEQEKRDLALAIKLQAEWNNVKVPTKRHGYMLRSAQKNKRQCKYS